MSDTFFHGVRVQEHPEGVRDLVTPSTAVIGIVGTAPEADADDFPLDTPILVTDLPATIQALGDDGTLAPALTAILEITTPIVVMVRVAVAVGEDAEADTIENIIGDISDGTGIYALLRAQAECRVKPKILGAPGFGLVDVASALSIVARKLLGRAYSGLDTADTVAEALTARVGFSGRELHVIFGDTSKGDAVARALGMRALIDETIGWHKTISNVPIPGVTGVSPALHFDPADMSSQTGLLNAAQITCIVYHGDSYRFWGNRNCSTDGEFPFESSTGTAQALVETMQNGMIWAADKPNHPTLAKDIIETINEELRQLKAQGRIIDGKAWLPKTVNGAAVNTATQLAGGQMVIDYDYTEVPPLEGLTMNQRKTGRYLMNFADQVGQVA